MTTSRVHFRIPAVRRALKVARDQNLIVTGYHIGADGSIHVEVAAEVPPPTEQIKQSDMTGEAA